MLTACHLFVELCAGSAAVTLRLLSAHARPPISYMGAKTGYAQAILHVLGLRSGQGAAACVLVEAGPWARAWRLLTTPEGCRAVAAVIRGWIGEDARALWERLRSEPTPEGEAEAVGAWLSLGVMAYRQGEPESGGPVERYSDIEGAHGALSLLSYLSWPQVQVVEGDVTEVDPREVARWLYVIARSHQGGGGFQAEYVHPGPKWTTDAACRAHLGPLALDRGLSKNPRPEMADKCDHLSSTSWPPTVVSNAPVQDVTPGILPPGTVVYFDPPYAGTTGYQAKLTRAQVLAVAQRWADAGATVCVSEAEPLPLPGWHHVEITGTRIGQKRTFSKQQHEWLTLNREPAWLPETQGTLGLEVIA